MESFSVSNLGQSRLLLIEQDAEMRATLTKTLSAHHEVEAVPDGLTASLAARHQPPDLVVIDLYLPGTDNLTLIRSLRADPRTAHVSIIALAASTHRELLLRCLSAGASNFLLKPFNVSELLLCIRTDMRLRAPCADLPAARDAALPFLAHPGASHHP